MFSLLWDVGIYRDTKPEANLSSKILPEIFI